MFRGRSSVIQRRAVVSSHWQLLWKLTELMISKCLLAANLPVSLTGRTTTCRQKAKTHKRRGGSRSKEVQPDFSRKNQALLLHWKDSDCDKCNLFSRILFYFVLFSFKIENPLQHISIFISLNVYVVMTLYLRSNIICCWLCFYLLYFWYKVAI